MNAARMLYTLFKVCQHDTALVLAGAYWIDCGWQSPHACAIASKGK